MTAHPTLFDTAPAGRARRTDPSTSVRAAAHRSGSARTAILEAFRQHGPMTDEQLADRLAPAGFHGPTVKTARSALKDAGFIVATTRTEPSRRGHPQIVWALHPQYRPTETIHDAHGRVT